MDSILGQGIKNLIWPLNRVIPHLITEPSVARKIKNKNVSASIRGLGIVIQLTYNVLRCSFLDRTLVLKPKQPDSISGHGTNRSICLLNHATKTTNYRSRTGRFMHLIS